ncbi:MAG: T9SS type A sorting domain-containing protein, partial [Flavobacterium sp.]
FTGTTSGSGLWKSNGTPSGTIEMPLGPGVVASNDNAYITTANGLVYFFASEGATNDLYVTNGTVTTKLLDCNASSLFPLNLLTNFVELDGYVYFAVGPNSSPQKELWRTDGTPSGTVSVASLFTPIVNPLSVSNITVCNDKIFFSGTLNDGNELMMLDPSTLKTTKHDKLNELTVFPNPSDGNFTVDFDFIEKASFSIYDLLGKKVAEGEIIDKKIHLSLKSGIYILKIEYENQYYSKKIIIRE